ncbi:hypothetical protein DY926_03295 [Komagataeibacter melaceti]|uniref:Uncharacterized protein n=1 Tax=Komagataeibacter melaceti TaxID=2766577 RepID=A0A371Z3A0_9PROT|nr:hypothetical protein [Komagataeibacter melaceti]RFD20958.1 hypothetical protein DY926_03295 [Komagataeibacter melaceti]
MFESSVIEIDGIFVGIVCQNGPDEPYRFRAMHERVTQMDGDILPTFEAAVTQARSRFRLGRAKVSRAMEPARLQA